MKLVAYLRVSSKGQVDRYGPDVQRAEILGWCGRNGHQIVAEAPLDVITGKTDSDDRPGLLDAIRMVRSGEVEGIIALDFKRIARQLTSQEAILALIWREGGRVFTTEDGEIRPEDPDDPMRDLIRQIMGSIAEFDRKTTVKKLRDARKAKALTGKHAVGQYRFGETGVGKGRDRDAGPHDGERVAIDRILALRQGGLDRPRGRSYREICALLDQEGITPRRATQWSPMTVRNIVQREQRRTQTT